jgi:hypothetical protein
MLHICIVKSKSSLKLEGIRVYGDTLEQVRAFVAQNPLRMSITRFYDEAAKEKLKSIYEQKNAGPITGGPNNSESSEV